MVGPYKRSKFLAEVEVRRMVAEEGLPAVIVNPSTPIGPRDVKPTPTGRIIVQAATGKMPAYVDTGLNVVHVEDVADGHLRAFEMGRIGERYILGGDNLSLAEILRQVAHLVDRKPPTIELDRSLVYPIAVISEAWARVSGREPMATLDGLRMAKWKMWFNSAKAERELGYTHRPAGVALGDAVRWFRDEGYLR
jgi:dihydroflavonol-4-reductase